MKCESCKYCDLKEYCHSTPEKCCKGCAYKYKSARKEDKEPCSKCEGYSKFKSTSTNN
jgi:hypothetical protein